MVRGTVSSWITVRYSRSDMTVVHSTELSSKYDWIVACAVHCARHPLRERPIALIAKLAAKPRSLIARLRTSLNAARRSFSNSR